MWWWLLRVGLFIFVVWLLLIFVKWLYKCGSLCCYVWKIIGFICVWLVMKMYLMVMWLILVLLFLVWSILILKKCLWWYKFSIVDVCFFVLWWKRFFLIVFFFGYFCDIFKKMVGSRGYLWNCKLMLFMVILWWCMLMWLLM